MPTSFDRINLAALYRPFADRLVQLVDACARRGCVLVATSGGRSYEEQAALYAQGRTTPGKIVTHAPPGMSMHNFFAAADLVPDRDQNIANGLQPDYSDPAFTIMGEEAERLGLEWGGRWRSIHDTPHVQLSIGRAGLALRDLDRAHKVGGLPAVFVLLDKHGPW